MRKNILLFLIIYMPFFVYSQQWHQYSDSIIDNINKKDFVKAISFSQLADNDISKTKIIKDTLYAHYLYAKGVLNYFESKSSVDFLVQSLDIWNKSSKKNQFKIMKIHYFLGQSYYILGKNSNHESDYSNSYNHYENCYLINKKYKLPKNNNFSAALYALILIDSEINKDFKKVKKYSIEYIELNRETAIQNFDFDVITVYRLNNDFVGQEKALRQFLLKYENEKLDDPKLLYKIYFELVNNNLSQKDKYGNFKNTQEIIKYGQKAYNIFELKQLPKDKYLRLILMSLDLVYSQLEDNINSEKYKQLQEKYFPTNQGVDKYEDLKKLIINEDYETFKIKFDEFEADLISKNDFNGLADIYSLALYSFEKNAIFRKEDVLEKLNFINSNKSKLTEKEQIDFECTLVEFYSLTNINLEEALKICNKNIDVEDINIKLFFYTFKSSIESSLGYNKTLKTEYVKLAIAIEAYGENDPRVLRHYIDILAYDVTGSDFNTTKIASKSLKIIYDNKLEETDIAAKVWFYLGGEAKRNGNYSDWFNYTNKCKLILEKNGDDSSFSLYNHCLLNLSKYYIIRLNEYEFAKIYLDQVKKYIEEIAFEDKEIESGYYSTLGDFYFFQHNFNEAKINYEKSSSKGENKVQIEFKIIICDYLIDQNSIKTIALLEKCDKENKTNLGSEYIYLLKYNLGDFKTARKLLIDLLKNIRIGNNQYFHLVSDYEKERIYKNFSIQFEFLNTYLLNYDLNFLKQYINFRFYSKSLLFSNSFKANYDIEKNKELYAELKNNKIQINKNIESKIEDTKNIEKLKYRNREIEKLLSINTEPLNVPTIENLNNKLKINEAYVEIIRINKQSRNAVIAPHIEKVFTDSISYGAIIIKKNTAPKFILIDGNNQLENNYAIKFKTQIQNKREDNNSYHLLFENIDNELKDVEKIYLVTDGVYNSINVEAIYNPSKKQYIIDYLKIQQIQNVRAITDEKKEIKISSTSKASLFGNPDFNLAISIVNKNEFSLPRNLDSSLLDEIKKDIKINSLAGTEKEIVTLNSILTEAKCDVEMYLTTSATEDNLKKVQSPDILHIATHGYFLKDEDTSKTKQSLSELINENYKDNSYLKSGLILAGAQNTLNGNQPENANNGILTAEEAKNLNLKGTELVVLSACETGLGDNIVGEGVIGLQRAFMIAGAKSVIMSLWSVSDEKTQQLMSLFYTNWIKNNMTKEEAFYKAKIAIKKSYPQPYYWAGFVLLE